jgi:ribosomal protein S6--L-glutamate ligase
MKIGVISSSDGYSNEELSDLKKAISKNNAGYVSINLSESFVRIEGGNVALMHTNGGKAEHISADAAVMRSIGIIRDYEQFSHRLWLAQALELNGMVISNKISSWVSASDKLGTLIILSKYKIPVPDTTSSENFFHGYAAVKKYSDTVIKPLRSGKGIGVFRISDPDAAMHIFSYFTNLSKPIYVQRFLDKKGGGDYRVVVVGGEVIGAEFRKAKGWKSNVAQGAEPRKAQINAEMREIAIKATEALKLDYAGIDIADTKDGYYVLEANPTISWSGFRRVTGVNPASYIVKNLISNVKN